MRNQKLLLGLLIVLFSGLCLVMLVFNGAIYSLVGLATLIPALISTVFCFYTNSCRRSIYVFFF